MKIIIQWVIDDEQSKEYEVDSKNCEYEEYHRYFTVDIRKLGVDPIKVFKDSLIHCKIKSKSD